MINVFRMYRLFEHNCANIRVLLCLALFFPQPLFAANEAGKNIDDFLSNLSESGTFSGSVAVVIDGITVVSSGYGLANIEHDVPNKPKTKIRVGSITKQFTATAILLLQDRSALNVKDTLGEHLPNMPDAWQTLTIHQLLNHTSGLTHPWRLPDFEQRMMVPHTVDEVLSHYYDVPLISEPGTEYHYSGVGYFLLSQIIEEVSGQQYHRFLRENIFDPLDMASTGSDRQEQIIRDRASGYEMVDGAVINAAPIYMQILTGGGDIYSTVEDMRHWHDGLTGKKLLSEESYAQMFTPGLNNYGYGWQIQLHNGLTMAMHTGGMPGFRSLFMTFPELDSCIIILSNNSSTNMQDILDYVVGVVLDSSPH